MSHPLTEAVTPLHGSVDPWELYNLKSDRAEQQNLAAKMPEKAKALSEFWQKQTDTFIALVKRPVTKGKDEKDE